jgi:flagellar biosynthetic protein FliR
VIPLSEFVEAVTVIALVFSRIGGFLVVSPFPGAWVPVKARVAVLISMSLCAGTFLPPPAQPIELGLGLLPIAATDFAIGVLIGAAFRFVLSSVEFMAGMISQASWLSAPISLNPEMGGQSQVLGQVSVLFAMLLALGVGVHRTVIAYLFESFHVLPIGAKAFIPAAIPPLVDVVGRSFDVGMRLALPVLAISLAVQAALALISRVAPSLQIFSIGFGVLVGTGLLTFMASMGAIGAGMLRYLATIPNLIDHILTLLSGV